eukprot:g5421.t1
MVRRGILCKVSPPPALTWEDHRATLKHVGHVDYVDACGLRDADVPLPHDHLRRIGNTPVIELADSLGLYAKLEGHSPGDSLKDRTITSIVMNSFKNG